MARLASIATVSFIALVVLQGVRLAGGQGWSWIYAIGYGVALLALAVAAISEARTRGKVP